MHCEYCNLSLSDKEIYELLFNPNIYHCQGHVDASGVVHLLKPDKGFDSIRSVKSGAPDGYILTQMSSGHIHWTPGNELCHKRDCYTPELNIDLKECTECGCTKEHNDQ